MASFLNVIQYSILCIFLSGSVFLYAQESEEDLPNEELAVTKVKQEYEKKITELKDFFWRYLNERIDQVRIEAKEEKNAEIIHRWKETLLQIEKLESQKEYSKILSVITLFNDNRIPVIQEDKKRLKTYFEKQDALDKEKYTRIQQEEKEALLEYFLHHMRELTAASKFVEMREILLQTIAENPKYKKDKNLLDISRALNVLLATRNLAFLQLKKSVGKKMRIRGMEVTIESFDGQTLIVQDAQRGKKSYLFQEFNLNDFLTLLGLRSFDGEFLFQTGIKYYLENQYKKAHETFLIAQQKGINCRAYLLKTEEQLGNIQRAELLKANELIEEKKYKEAEQVLDRILQENPESWEANFMKGEIKIGQNRLSEAYGIYEKLQPKYPKNTDILRQLSELSRKLKLQDSYIWSEKLLAIVPDDKQHSIITCKEYKKQNKPEKYLELAIKIQQQNPQLIETNLLLADAYNMNQKWNESQKIFESILQERPTQWQAQQGLGECFVQQKRMSVAQEYYENLLPQLKSEKKKEIIRKRIKEMNANKPK